MKVVISPDSFKGSMSTMSAAEQIEAGILAVFPTAQTVMIPMADGGEGTAETYRMIAGGEMIWHEVKDPGNRDILASYCWIEKERTAVIETAAASGLTLLKEAERKPDGLSTFGTGQLIRLALDRGAKRIIIGLGGSATIDAGLGCLQALGLQCFDRDGKGLNGGVIELGAIASMDASPLDPRLSQIELIIASDVKNPLLGSEGAVHIFGPQKGLKPDETDNFERQMSRIAELVVQESGQDMRTSPGAGAAGGLGFALQSFFPNLSLMSGFELIAQLSGLEQQIAAADLVITGEGKFDGQSMYGKAPIGISRLAKQHDVPVVVFTGRFEGTEQSIRQEGVHAVVPIVDKIMALDESMDQGEVLLKQAVIRFFETMRLAGHLTARGVKL
ncbi:glycerate kinase [Paenibacillus aestuarii]|uniref:Glycerate kinase n=1 Tax=Paenibacillus aestuarii TaxID=516965 RepID=A0ABW0KJL7_9BACL|nr:glycerate kinase [Paenibacillus aestuarii]